ncbi:hypothetical protein DL766_008152 [Monosporascus sp. MC13-8B]|uniref:Mif2/CENP-C cupin domain-containing protein n=1 Tax=Monosporascus cannonballus TaxID=155416 RepID=A0ABY0GR00_9PEZI|nr:hypothetical protein DL762_010282 [Monosporascus cannonballus]RYP20601.1 hypothetical protein DL766_008152 [Monosporascus sp. MC13-8B]
MATAPGGQLSAPAFAPEPASAQTPNDYDKNHPINQPSTSFTPHPEQTAAEHELRDSFLRGSMSREVEEKLKGSAELRRMVLGTPVSLKAKEAVVGGQMSSELRSKMIHDITSYQKPRSTVREAAAGAQRQSASPIAAAAGVAGALTGNSNSARRGASDNPSGLDPVTPATSETSPTKDGMKTDPQPPKRFAKRSNRPERPLIGLSALSKENYRPSTTTAFPKLGPMWRPTNPVGQDPVRVVSDIRPLPSDQDASIMTSVDKSLKRKRNSLSMSSGDSAPHSDGDRSSSEPSQRQKLLKLAARHSSKATRAEPSSAISYKSKSKIPGSRKEESLDRPAPSSMDKEQIILEPDDADDASFREQLFALDSHSSDEDYFEEGDGHDSEGDSDGKPSIILGQEVHGNEEVAVNYESTSGVADEVTYNYTLFKTATGQTVRTAAVPAQLKSRYAREQRNSGAFHAQLETPSTTKKTADIQAAPNSPRGESGEELWQYVHQYLKHTPFSPIPQTGHVPQMLTLPRVRDVEFREKLANPYSEARAQDISALIMQVTGQEPPHPCSRCQEGKGPFKGCYLISVEAPQSTRNLVRACANCFYKCNQTYCDLKDWSLQAYPELAGSSEPKQTSTQSPARTNPSASKSYPERRSDRIVFKESIAESSSASNKPPAVTEGHDEPSINISPNQSMINGPRPQTRRDGHTSVQDDSILFSNHQMAAANPAQLLELETWEIAPGRIRGKGDLPFENVAFSTTYLSQQGQAITVAPNIAFQVVIVRPGTTHMWKKDGTGKLRLCSVAAGKVKVKMHDEEFTIGPHGMFKVGPGVECTAINTLYVDAMLHISVLPGNLGAD